MCKEKVYCRNCKFYGENEDSSLVWCEKEIDGVYNEFTGARINPYTVNISNNNMGECKYYEVSFGAQMKLRMIKVFGR